MTRAYTRVFRDKHLLPRQTNKMRTFPIAIMSLAPDSGLSVWGQNSPSRPNRVKHLGLYIEKALGGVS